MKNTLKTELKIDILNKIEKQLYINAESMRFPVVDRDLGVVLFFASMYSYTKDEMYKTKALELFNKTIEVFPQFDFNYSLVEGFEGIFWVVNHLKTCGVLENEDVLISMKPYLLESIAYDLENDNFNLLHGCFGKIQYYMFSKENNPEEKLELVNKVIDKLYDGRIEENGLINWKDSNFKNGFNIRFFNGHTSILNFLLKLKDLEYKNTKIDYLIGKLLPLLIETIDLPKKVSIRGKVQSEGESKYYNIVEYHGNLTMAFTLYYAGIIMNRDDLKKKAHDLTLKVCKKKIEDSGIMYNDEYAFHDIGLACGLGGVTFLLYRLNQWINDSRIDESLTLWKNELEKNTIKVLDIKGDVLMPQVIQNKKGDYYYEKNSLYDGVLGAGLVLSSINHNKDNWSNYLGFY